MANALQRLFQKHPVFYQLLRYGMIGVLTNGVGYAIYLLLTAAGFAPKWAMTLLYVSSATLSYIGNKKITFAHQGRVFSTAARYSIAHVMGYVINLLLQMVLVDQWGYDHRMVQLMAIFIVATFLFASFKFFVFAPAKHHQS